MSETTPHAASAAFDEPDEFNDSEPAPGYERYRIARQVVLLRPKEPYVRWVHKSLRRGPKYARKVPEYVKALSNKPGVPTLVELGKHSTAYLIELYEEEGLSCPHDPQAQAIRSRPGFSAVLLIFRCECTVSTRLQ